MKIKLTANALEAKNFLSAIQGLECGYAYNHGFGEDDEVKSWGLKVFAQIDKLFSLKNPLPDNEKNIIKAIGESAVLLENTLAEDDKEHIRNMRISMSVPSSFNSSLRSFVEHLYDLQPNIVPNYLRKLYFGSSNTTAAIQPHTQKMIISSNLFNQEGEKTDFFTNIVKNIGTEESVKFVVFHEASHAFQHTNAEKNPMEWDSNISPLLEVIKYGNFHSNNSPGKSQIYHINKMIEDEKLNLKPLDPVFMENLRSLTTEIYADVGAILLARNAEINDGKYSKEKTSSLISSISQARLGEYSASIARTKGCTSSWFDHFTSPGLEHLKDILGDIPDRTLSQKEINQYCNECIKVGIARLVVTSTFVDANRVGEIKTLFHTNIIKDQLEVSESPDCDLMSLRFSALKKVAGQKWFDEFYEDMKKIQEMKLTGSDNLLWIAGLKKDNLESTISKNIEMSKELDELFSDKNKENPPINKKEDIVNSISSIRNKSLMAHLKSLTRKI